MNFEALFKITYGLYIVSSGDKSRGNGFISNTVFQVTSEPPKFAICCNKDNYTSEFIEKHSNFSVSVLHKDASKELFGTFGYKSGKDLDKLEGMDVQYGKTGAPIVMNDCIAYIECKVVDKIDVGTHWIFIGDLIDAEIIDDSKDPITYAIYRDVKKAVAPKNAPTYIDKSKFNSEEETEESAKYKCSVCGYIHDEEKKGVKFDDLPTDWKCPVCGADKDDFEKIT